MVDGIGGWGGSQVRNPTSGVVYIVLEARLDQIAGAAPRESKASKQKKGPRAEAAPFEVTAVC